MESSPSPVLDTHQDILLRSIFRQAMAQEIERSRGHFAIIPENKRSQMKPDIVDATVGGPLAGEWSDLAFVAKVSGEHMGRNLINAGHRQITETQCHTRIDDGWLEFCWSGQVE